MIFDPTRDKLYITLRVGMQDIRLMVGVDHVRAIAAALD